MKLTEMNNLISSAVQSLNQVQQALTTVQTKQINESKLNESLDPEYNEKMAICLYCLLFVDVDICEFASLLSDDNNIRLTGNNLSITLWSDNGCYFAGDKSLVLLDVPPNDVATFYKPIMSNILKNLGFTIEKIEFDIDSEDDDGECQLEITAHGNPNLTYLKSKCIEIQSKVDELNSANHWTKDVGSELHVFSFLNPKEKLAGQIDNICKHVLGSGYDSWSVNDKRSECLYVDGSGFRNTDSREISKLGGKLNNLFSSLNLNISISLDRSHDNVIIFDVTDGYDKLRRARKQA